MPHGGGLGSATDTCNGSWSVSSKLPIASRLVNSHDVVNSVLGLVLLNFTKQPKNSWKEFAQAS